VLHSHGRAARHDVVMQEEKTCLLRERGLAAGACRPAPWVEPTSLLQALHAGVGYAKAVGCGFLLVRPVANPRDDDA